MQIACKVLDSRYILDNIVWVCMFVLGSFIPVIALLRAALKPAWFSTILAASGGPFRTFPVRLFAGQQHWQTRMAQTRQSHVSLTMWACASCMWMGCTGEFTNAHSKIKDRYGQQYFVGWLAGWWSLVRLCHFGLSPAQSASDSRVFQNPSRR